MQRPQKAAEAAADLSSLLGVSEQEGQHMAGLLGEPHALYPAKVWLPEFLALFEGLGPSDRGSQVSALHVLQMNPQIRRTSIKDLHATLWCLRGEGHSSQSSNKLSNASK